MTEFPPGYSWDASGRNPTAYVVLVRVLPRARVSLERRLDRAIVDILPEEGAAAMVTP